VLELAFFSSFLLHIEKRARKRRKTKKKHQKNVPRNSNDLKCFAMAGFEQELKNLLMKFLEASAKMKREKSLHFFSSSRCSSSNVSISVRVMLFNMLKKEHAKAKKR
jgi:hypothetical protein